MSPPTPLAVSQGPLAGTHRPENTLKMRALSPNGQLYRKRGSPLAEWIDGQRSETRASISPTPQSKAVKVLKPKAFVRKTQQFIDVRKQKDRIFQQGKQPPAVLGVGN